MIGKVELRFPSEVFEVEKVFVWKLSMEVPNKPFNRAEFSICLQNADFPFPKIVWYTNCKKVDEAIEKKIDEVIEAKYPVGYKPE